MIRSRSVVGGKGRGWWFGSNRMEKLQRGTRKLLGWSSWLWWWLNSYIHILKLTTLYSLNMCSLLFANYTSLFLKRNFKRSYWLYKNIVECFGITQYIFILKTSSIRYRKSKYYRWGSVCGDGGGGKNFLKSRRKMYLECFASVLKLFFHLRNNNL